MDAVALSGLEFVISISLAPTPPNLSMDPDTPTSTTTDLPKIHLRTYTVKLLASGVRTPRAELVPMGPFIDFTLRRHTDPDPDVLLKAMKRPKLAKDDVEKGLGKRKKNVEVDEMGDVRAKIHISKQNLDKLQTRKMKGLKGGLREEDYDPVAGDGAD